MVPACFCYSADLLLALTCIVHRNSSGDSSTRSSSVGVSPPATTKFAGNCLAMLSKRLGFDPAITAGPFETALQDVLGVTIFLSLATALLQWIS